MFENARQLAPSLILIDEIDSLCSFRQNSQNDIERRITAALCSHIDAIVRKCLFIYHIASKLTMCINLNCSKSYFAITCSLLIGSGYLSLISKMFSASYTCYLYIEQSVHHHQRYIGIFFCGS